MLISRNVNNMNSENGSPRRGNSHSRTGVPPGRGSSQQPGAVYTAPESSGGAGSQTELLDLQIRAMSEQQASLQSRQDERRVQQQQHEQVRQQQQQEQEESRRLQREAKQHQLRIDEARQRERERRESQHQQGQYQGMASAHRQRYCPPDEGHVRRGAVGQRQPQHDEEEERGDEFSVYSNITEEG